MGPSTCAEAPRPTTARHSSPAKADTSLTPRPKRSGHALPAERLPQEETYWLSEDETAWRNPCRTLLYEGSLASLWRLVYPDDLHKTVLPL